MVGLSNYQNPTKETWRGWQWNRIVDLLLGPRPGKPWSKHESNEKRWRLSDKTVLYLCGPDDSDRQAAIRHGFRTENLIAVDLNKENLQRARNAGGLGLSHSLSEVLLAWPRGWPIDAIVADFCCSYGMMSQAFMWSLYLAAYTSKAVVPKRTVVSINLQRGRDSITNEMRDDLRVIAKTFDLIWPDWTCEKHRGQMWCQEFALTSTWLGLGHVSPTGEWDTVASESQRLEVDVLVREAMKPQFFAYKSNRVFMDSAVCVVPPMYALEERAGQDGIVHSDEQVAWLTEALRVYHGVRRTKKAVRKAAALRAVRTMKLQKSLNGVPCVSGN